VTWGPQGVAGPTGVTGPEAGGTHGCRHIDDRGSDPLRDIYGRALTLSGSIAGQPPRQGTPMVSGAGQLCAAPCGLPEARLLQPRQSDLRRIHIPAVKDTLRSVHRQVYHCPVSVQFDEPAAGDGPQKTGAAGIVEGPLRRASQPSPAARSAQFSEGLKNLLQSSTNWRHRCLGTSPGGQSGSSRGSLSRESLPQAKQAVR
jgi:hypothetical protein